MLIKEGREEMKIKTFVQYKLGKCLLQKLEELKS